MSRWCPAGKGSENSGPSHTPGSMVTAMTSPTESVDFHFDVMCPWAYQTSRWIRSVREETGLEINWRFFSLEEVNRIDGKKHPWERSWSYGWSMMQIGSVLRRQSMDLVDAWYERAGRALHEEGHKPHEPAVARHLLAEIGLDPTIVDEALSDPTTHDEIRADHERVIAAGGYGVPTLFLDGHCLFGPVLLDPPTGREAVELWEAVKVWARFPELYELQHPKTDKDSRRIGEVFRPYIEARDWVSIDRGRVITPGSQTSEELS